METDFPVLQGSYLRDLLSQPRAVSDTVDGLGKLGPLPSELRRYPTIVLTGMGSSLHALHPLQIALVRAGRCAMITGRGASLAAVGTGALILKESTRFHAEGMSSPAFRHGPLEMVSPELFALVFSGDRSTSDLNERLVRDVVSVGGRAALVGEQVEAGVFQLPRVSDRLRPIFEMLPVQMMSLGLAELAGREPGVFEHATKVTATE